MFDDNVRFTFHFPRIFTTISDTYNIIIFLANRKFIPITLVTLVVILTILNSRYELSISHITLVFFGECLAGRSAGGMTHEV